MVPPTPGSTRTDTPLPYTALFLSVLGAVRGAREVPGAAAGSTFAVGGESQGGHAALWTAISARSYAPDLTLVATAAAAPPTDLAANLREGKIGRAHV